MGGYGAMRLARCLRLDQAILVSPQFTLDRTILPGEQRYPEAKHFDAGLGDLAVFAKPDLAGVVIFDPFRPLDRQHAGLIVQRMPGMALAGLAFGGHPATSVLRKLESFRSLQTISLTPGARACDLVALHRRLRSGSARYWWNRSEACHKAGHPAAAQIAVRRAMDLQTPEDPIGGSPDGV